jgi:hypothetical protein
VGASIAGCTFIFSYEPFDDAVAPPPDVCGRYTEGPGACAGAFRDCNDDPADGCEISVDSDAAHCGYCGHRCPEGGCEDGWCNAEPLATQAEGVQALGVHQGFLYVVDAIDQTQVVALDSGDVAVVADFGGPSSFVAFDGDFAYLTSYAPDICQTASGWCVAASPLGTTTTSILGETSEYPYALAVCGDYVFVADDIDGGRILRLDKQGGNETTVVSAQGATDHLACDASHVYWAGANGLARVPLGEVGATPEILAAAAAGALALSGGNVYWHDTGAIRRMPTSGGAVETVAEGVPSATWLAVAEPYVYWSDGVAIARRVLCSGTENENVPAEPPAFATADHLYYTGDNATTVARRRH